MLQNAYFLAKIGADTAENEQHFAEILPIGRRVADRCPLDLREALGLRGGHGRRLLRRLLPLRPGRPRFLKLGCKEGCGLNLNFELF